MNSPAHKKEHAMRKEILMVHVVQPPVEDRVEDDWREIKKKIGIRSAEPSLPAVIAWPPDRA